MHERVAEVTARIVARSHDARSLYLDRLEKAATHAKTPRSKLGCANQAHAFAAAPAGDKVRMALGRVPNLGIVTAYNDMLSAHQPYETFPELIRQAARDAGGTAQVAGGVPAMCDGVTQGEAGMELSLFSRDVIALATAVALSHQTFDAVVYLGICDKIVPGLVIGALAFGHLPAVFIPAGPMTTGLSNVEKSHTRQLYAEGKVGREELLASEMGSYHGPGTCTFYGTANTNQMLMEVMGLHLPGAAFINPGTKLREALTREAARRALSMTAAGNNYTPIGRLLDERAFVNGIVGLHATGGSTNHTIHLIAMANAAGITLTWDDLSQLAEITPLLARVYPNGKADVNHFHAAGGMAFLIRELLDGGLLHPDVSTVAGGLRSYASEPFLEPDGGVVWRDIPAESAAPDILRGISDPFNSTGGLRVLHGDLGAAVIKTSAVHPERHIIEAPAIVFHTQDELAGGVQGRRPRARLRGGGALPRTEGQRHAGAAQADAAPQRVAGSGLPRRARDRRAPVGRVRQGAGGDPRDAGGARRRRDRQGRRRRRDPRRFRHGADQRARAAGGLGGAAARRSRSVRQRVRLRPRSVRDVPRQRERGGPGSGGVLIPSVDRPRGAS